MVHAVMRSILVRAFNQRTTGTLGPGFRGLPQAIRVSILSPKLLSSILGARHSSSATDNDHASSVDSPTRASTGSPLETGERGEGDSQKELTPTAETKPKEKEKGKAKGNKKSGKSKNKKKSKQGNEHIVAALANAIREDDWPNIIRHSILDPRNLDGWYPGESDYLAAHRMSEALSILDEHKLRSVCDGSVISAQKLARVLAKQHMGQVEHLPDPDDPEEIEFYRDWNPAFGYDFEEVWDAHCRAQKLKKAKKPVKPDGSPPDSS